MTSNTKLTEKIIAKYQDLEDFDKRKVIIDSFT